MSYFIKNQDFEAHGRRVRSWRSVRTGIQVVLVDIDVPLTKGKFTKLIIIVLNDSGCPHTLEHLIFLGSKKYPYKGVLDFLANRSFAQGTNAWTETDHTAYTISTAGTEGFLHIFPIFIDHILFPTLTYDGFYTEIHHIDGDGNDAGVVYSEMQGHENTLNDLQLIHSQRALFPEGIGYRSYTGGNLKALRVLNVETVRKYHSKYYLPQNLCIIITGKIDVNELFYVLDQIIEPNILNNLTPNLENWKRPWVDSPKTPPLKKSHTEIVLFPDKDETVGEVLLAWLGPFSTEFLTLTALNLLGKYLTDSAISALQKELVEIEDQFCSDISFSMTIRLPSVIYLNLYSVPTKKLEKIEERVFELLNSVRDNPENFDINRMSTIIHREKLAIMDTNETDLDGIFTNVIITDFLYGSNTKDTLKRSLQDYEDYENLKLWTVTEWLQLLDFWFIQNFHICIISKASAKLSLELEKNEKIRIENQRKKLGEEGLKKLREQLRISQEKNDAPFPLTVVSDFKIPSVKNINFITSMSARAGVAKQKINNTHGEQCSDLQKYIDQDSLEKIPLYLYFNHINSKFVTIQVYISSEHVNSDLKPYLGIYLDNFFLNGVVRSDGTKLTYEEVVRLLENETVDYSASWGVSASFLEIATIQIKVEIQNYKKGIFLLKDLFYGSIFEPQRLMIFVFKSLNDIPQEKRNGNKICWALMRMYQLDKNLSTSKAINILSQINFLKRLKDELEKEPNKVVEKFKTIQNQLFKPENMYFQIISDILNLEHPVLSWKSFINHQEKDDINMSRIPYKKIMLTEKGRTPSGIAHIISLSTVENSYSVHVSKLFSDFNHKDFPAFILLLSYLNIMEGILWKHIRGAGLAYSVSFKTDIESGFVYYSIYSSPNVFNVWEKTRVIINDIKNKKISFDENIMINAKSSLVYDIVSIDSTPFFAAQESFVSQVIKNQPENKRRQLIDEISNITIDELYVLHNKYLVNLFNSKTSDSFIVTTSSKCDEIMQGFSDAGYNITKKTFNDY
ncbi:hypothetical protein PNEG_02221 [Pneumocystis murina B123]|uniref:Presequence protease, mitochondrial n=1 Tax=Pneumocystis murina (strain B123) TaxID=1069680 RepID=M7NLU3_PNEMU|nr:hypothetical protein PNEG_02221 [Pneumocystis murina B123]EMR09638.1 hypothetical protein PNEG_02221 [Pneumocystis murina B123]